jgi:hypothetical protein
VQTGAIFQAGCWRGAMFMAWRAGIEAPLLWGTPPPLYFYCKVLQIKGLFSKVLIAKEFADLPEFFSFLQL